MKNLLLLSGLFLLANTVHAQEQQQPARTLTTKPVSKQTAPQSAPVKLEKVQTAPATIPSPPTDTLAGETIRHCDLVIEAIDHKVEYIRSDQTKSERAEASGWFDQMARNRAVYVARKEALIQREQNH